MEKVNRGHELSFLQSWSDFSCGNCHIFFFNSHAIDKIVSVHGKGRKWREQFKCLVRFLKEPAAIAAPGQHGLSLVGQPRESARLESIQPRVSPHQPLHTRLCVWKSHEQHLFSSHCPPTTVVSPSNWALWIGPRVAHILSPVIHSDTYWIFLIKYIKIDRFSFLLYIHFLSWWPYRDGKVWTPRRYTLSVTAVDTHRATFLFPMRSQKAFACLHRK